MQLKQHYDIIYASICKVMLIPTKEASLLFNDTAVLLVHILYHMHVLQGDFVARGPKLLSIKNYVIEIIT